MTKKYLILTLTMLLINNSCAADNKFMNLIKTNNKSISTAVIASVVAIGAALAGKRYNAAVSHASEAINAVRHSPIMQIQLAGRDTKSVLADLAAIKNQHKLSDHLDIARFKLSDLQRNLDAKQNELQATLYGWTSVYRALGGDQAETGFKLDREMDQLHTQINTTIDALRTHDIARHKNDLA